VKHLYRRARAMVAEPQIVLRRTTLVAMTLYRYFELREFRDDGKE
jgi:hypothetical protein